MYFFQKLEIKVYFLISQPNDDNLKGIIQEMDLFNDVIITDLEENYWNLHHKVNRVDQFKPHPTSHQY